MVGLPFVGTVGACAGNVVAITSPNDLPKKFNWARVLRHEFVHVVTLQQTHFAIPHWYTEALAVRLEGGPRPAAWNVVLVERAKAGTLLDLDSLNLGFIRPKNQDEWALAYCQAELYAEYMVARYGEDSLVKLLEAYADNLATDAAIRRSFGVEIVDFEKGYREYVGGVVSGIRDPHAVKREKSLASVYLQTGEKRKLRDSLRRLAEGDDDDRVFRKKLLELAIEAEDFEDAVRWGTEVLQIDVTDAEVHAWLGRAYGALEKLAAAIDELQTAVQLAPQEADWRLSLAEVCMRAGRKQQAVQALRELLVEYPGREDARELLKRAEE
jgi:tetratricopeptide (TPR) repeat protein